MSSNVYYWKRDLQRFKEQIATVSYVPRYKQPALSVPHRYAGHRSLNTKLSVTADDVQSILKFSELPPHGSELFAASGAPQLPTLPSEPYRIRRDARQRISISNDTLPHSSGSHSDDPEEAEARKLFAECQALREQKAQSLAQEMELDDLQLRQQKSELDATHDKQMSLQRILEYSDHQHALAECLRRPVSVRLDTNRKLLLIEIEIPNFDSFSFVKVTKTDFKPVSNREENQLREKLIYALVLRISYLAAKSDEHGCFDTITVNARQSWRDKTSGHLKTGIVASIQASRKQFEELDIGHLDPKMCFHALKGIRTPNLQDVAPIRPIFELNTDDERIVEGRDVSQIDCDQNLAAMNWEDFEHLVRQLFEWEFGKNGAEVRITRASRDRGVDAIMFDPDPIRGGKYIIQAKRYTLTVGVEAVRDLYGTVINEGANRGILVTTSSYGPDAYEFSRGKPISLVDGAHLLAMLEKHGKHFRIDLADARKLDS